MLGTSIDARGLLQGSHWISIDLHWSQIGMHKDIFFLSRLQWISEWLEMSLIKARETVRAFRTHLNSYLKKCTSPSTECLLIRLSDVVPTNICRSPSPSPPHQKKTVPRWDIWGMDMDLDRADEEGMTFYTQDIETANFYMPCLCTQNSSDKICPHSHRTHSMPPTI